ncbi:MAG TPA: GNAT family N-acetyltransferase [Ramlibacter sp.]
MALALHVRRGEMRDADTIARFNAAMARETEGKELIDEVIGAGVRRLLATPSLGFYLVAEHDGKVVACLMITNEWSDWRNGLFWWIQSVYVDAAYRRKGVYRRMYEEVRALAKADAGVCGFRLYVEKENEVAHATYASLGMKETDYFMYEELKPGIRFLKP